MESVESESKKPVVPVKFQGKRVLIIGAGFGGINVAKKLGGSADNSDSLEVTILDRHNYHLFQPLLYQVAMAGLSPGDIAMPIRSIIADNTNTRVNLAEAKSVDLKAKVVHTSCGPYEYDYLVLGLGSHQSYFGHEEWEPYAPGLKSLEQATEVRRRVLTSFEVAERETNPERIRQLLTFVVVGGGPTGVELAGSLGEIARHTLAKDFRHIDPASAQVILIEAGPKILASFDEKLIAKAVTDLTNLGVTVRTNTKVTKIADEGVSLEGGELIRADTILWAAGVKPAPLNSTLGTPMDRQGRLIVTNDCSLEGHPEVFVIGDQACFMGEKGKPLPGLAPVAMQQGRAVAASILNDQRGHARKPFKYFDKGQMATIGRLKAVAQTDQFKMSGMLAWFAWLLVHIYYLVGFRNRIVVLIQWFWSYATYKKGAQIITNREWQSFSTPPGDGPPKKVGNPVTN